MPDPVYESIFKPRQEDVGEGGVEVGRATPDIARTKGSRLMNFISLASDGEVLLNALGLDISGAPRPLRFAAQNLLSPIGIVATASVPVTGGVSLAVPRLLGGVATKAAVKLGTRLVPELAVSAAAQKGAELASKAVPEDAPLPLQIGASLLGGALGAIPVATGIRRAVAVKMLPKTIAYAAERAADQAAAEAQGLKWFRPIRSNDSFMDDIGSENPVIRALSRPGIAPTNSIVNETEKRVAALARQFEVNNGVTTTTLARAFPGGFRSMEVDARGLVTNVPAAKDIHYLDVMRTDNAPEVFKLTSRQAVEWSRAHEILTDLRKLRIAQGISWDVPLEKGKLYFPGDPRSKGAFDYAKMTDHAEKALWDNATAANAAGVAYADPATTLHGYVKATLDVIAQKQFDEALQELLVTPSIAARATKTGKIAYGERYRAIKASNQARRKYNAALEEAETPPDYAARAQEMRAVREAYAANRPKAAIALTEDQRQIVDRSALEARSLGSLTRQLAEYRDAEKASIGFGGPAPTFIAQEIDNITADIAATKELLDSVSPELRSHIRERLMKIRASADEEFYQATGGNDPGFAAVRLVDARAAQETVKIFDEWFPPTRETVAAVAVSADKARSVQANVATTLKTLNDDFLKKHAAFLKANADWVAAQERTILELPGSLFGRSKGTGNIEVAKWQGGFLPKGEVKRLEEWTRQKSERPSKIISSAQQVGDAIRTMAATADVASPFIQGLPLLARDPVAWGKLVTGTTLAMFRPDVQTRYLRVNFDAAIDMVQNGRIAPGDIEMFKALERGGLVERGLRTQKPVLRQAAAPFRAGLKRFQSAYDTSLMIARVEMWKSLRPTWSGDAEQLGKFIRNATGALETKTLGIGPGQRAAESMIFFAPKLLRSTLALVGDAARPWTPQGGEAAHTLLRLMGSGVAVMMLANIAVGMGNGESEEDIIGRLREISDPTKGRKFMSVKVGDNWYGIGGQFRGVTQFIAKSIMNKGELTKQDMADNPIARFAAGRMSPLASLTLGSVELITHEEHNLLPFELVDKPADLAGLVGTSMLPFFVQGALDNIQNGGNFEAPVYEFVGARTSVVAPVDRLNEEAQRQYGMNWADLNDTEQDALSKAGMADIIKKKGDIGDKAEREYRRTRDENVAQATSDIVASFDRVKTGKLSREDFRETIQTIKHDLFIQNEEARRAFGVEFGPADTPKRMVINAYFRTFVDAAIATGSAQVDWDRWEEEQAKLTTRVAAGEFGPPARAQQFLDERRKFELPAEVKWFEANQEYIESANYWPVKEAMFAERILPSLASMGLNITSASELQQAENLAIEQGDQDTFRRLRLYNNRLNEMTSRARQLMRRRDPKLDRALKENGMIDVPVRGS